MKFGSRSAVEVTFKTTRSYSGIGDDKLLDRAWEMGEPVLYFDSLKTTTTEGEAETVYAQGGAGNPRLIAWEGDKTVTFTFEDALISAESLAILAGADLIEATTDRKIRLHKKAVGTAIVSAGDLTGKKLTYDLADDVTENETLLKEDIFGFIINAQGEIIERLGAVDSINGTEAVFSTDIAIEASEATVLVDFYIEREDGLQEISIEADKFAGYFYIEGDTLFRRQSDGKDLPAQMIIPNAKIQTAFELSMSPEGDPSTFTFTADAFPGTLKGDLGGTPKLYAMRIVNEE